MNEFITVAATGAAERTGIEGGFAGQRQQGAHVDADQVAGRDPDHRRQRPVHAQHFVSFIVHHDVIGDGVKNFHPVPVGLFDAGEQASIFQGHGGAAGNGFD